jgi:hypothetical protein
MAMCGAAALFFETLTQMRKAGLLLPENARK